MRRSIRVLATRISIAFLVLFFVYVLTVVLFLLKASSVALDLRSTYNQYQDSGFDTNVRNEILELTPRIDSVIADLQSPLIYPLVSQLDQKAELDLWILAYRYTKDAIPALGDFAGLSQQKRYLVAFQNSAEARGTGGIIGAFAVVSLSKGEVEVQRVGTNAILQSLNEIPIKMPQEFVRIYRSDPAIWQNSNLSPHFPYGAEIWLALWQRQFNEKLDGVITLDPIVLKSLLKLTGPIMVRGAEISSENVVAETLSDSYLRYEKDNFRRKQYLVEIIEQVAEAIKERPIPVRNLVREMIAPLLEHRILVYSSETSTQRILQTSPISGVMSLKASNEFRLVVINTAGNKMDYYIDRQLKLSSKACRNRKITEASFTISNTAKKDSYLPAYVKGRLDLDAPEGKENSTALTVFLYGPPRAKLLSAMDQSDGTSAGFVKNERGRQALVIPLELKAGEERSFVADFQGGQGPITTHIQPLVRKQITQIQDECNQ